MSVMSPVPEGHEGQEPCERTIAATFAPTAASIRDARRFVAALVDAHEDAEVAALLVSELATNAVRHASGPFTVVIVLGGPRLRVEVFDRGTAHHLSGRAFGSEPDDTGIGLRLLEELATSWGVEAVADGKAVYFEL